MPREFSFWPHWVFVAAHGLSLVAVLCHGAQTPHCGYSCGARALSICILVVVACGIFQDQGSNSCPLHWQVDS